MFYYLMLCDDYLFHIVHLDIELEYYHKHLKWTNCWYLHLVPVFLTFFLSLEACFTAFFSGFELGTMFTLS